MFGTLFLGTILAVFLTLGAVRGDAERGLLQPLLVRPLRRRTLLLARGSPRPRASAAAYVVVVFLAATVITWAFGGWWPDRIVVPALALAAAVVDPRRAVARPARSCLAVDRERDRRLHALRRRA